MLSIGLSVGLSVTFAQRSFERDLCSEVVVAILAGFLLAQASGQALPPPGGRSQNCAKHDGGAALIVLLCPSVFFFKCNFKIYIQSNRMSVKVVADDKQPFPAQDGG